MDIKWTDDGDGTKSARVGSVILLVTPHDDGVWTAEIKIKYGTVDEATFKCSEDAIRWCGRRLPDIIDPLVATARAEAALAEREACAGIAGDVCDSDVSGYLSFGASKIEHAIRARTTPATLSTETLAAIAEARGLRVVEPGLLAGLELPALRWERRENGELVGYLPRWSLVANRRLWAVRAAYDGTLDSVTPVCGLYTTDGIDANRRAAEAALRSLGVPFVVEDGGVL